MRGPTSVKTASRPLWVGLAIWVQVAGGTSSTFALYSHALKVSLDAHQSRLALLGVVCDVGENHSLPRVLYNCFHPALFLLISADACLLRYGTVWLLIVGVELRNDEPPFVQAAR